MQDDKVDCRKSAEISKLLENDKSVIDYHLLSELLRKVDLGADRETINLEVSKIAKRNKAAKISSLNDQDKILVLFKKHLLESEDKVLETLSEQEFDKYFDDFVKNHMSENQASLKKYFEFLNSLNETKMFNEALKKVDLAEIKKIAFNKKTIYEEFEGIFSSKVKKIKRTQASELKEKKNSFWRPAPLPENNITDSKTETPKQAEVEV